MHSTGMGSAGLSERARREDASDAIRTYRLGDYALIDVSGVPPRLEDVQRALLWEWSASPAGVLIRFDTDERPDDRTVHAITADAAALVQAWPGTPIGLMSHWQEVRDLVAEDPRGHHLIFGATVTEVWGRLWSRGGKASFTVELPTTVEAARTAREVVARACVDWDLTASGAPAALLADDVVARSVLQGAQDIRFTVSRHRSRVRVLACDDVPSTVADEPKTIEAVFGVQSPTPAMSNLADSVGEFALGSHHVRWAMTRESEAPWDMARPPERSTG